MYGELGTNSHDFVSEFVELPAAHEPFDFSHDLGASHEHSEHAGHAGPKPSEISLQELFYSPMMSGAPGSAEPTPLMTPNDHTFAMPPSYFSPSLSPGLPASEMPEFELPKKAAQPTGQPAGSRVTKKLVRRKWAVSRAGSISSSGGQSRHNSSASPNSDENEQETEEGAPAATPASLMNVSSVIPGQNPEMEQRLNQALLATEANLAGPAGTAGTAGSTGTPGQYYVTPTIRPRRTPSHAHSRSVTSSPALAPYISPALAPADADDILAQKSNYQNIVEGKHAQLGLQYPERLTSDITSKKASHKIAEQERRNRINVAISELGRMIAPEVPMTSKAATVEAAITYIKEMHEEIRALKQRLGE